MKKIIKFQIIWNKNDSLLAVSFFMKMEIGRCPQNGKILFFKFENLTSFNNYNEGKILKSYSSKIELETNSCIKFFDSHPSISNIFNAGSFNGEIYINLCNNDYGKDLIEFLLLLILVIIKNVLFLLNLLK